MTATSKTTEPNPGAEAAKKIAAIAKKNQRAVESLSLRALRKADPSLQALTWRALMEARADAIADNVDAQLKRAVTKGPVPKELPEPSIREEAYAVLPLPSPLAQRFGPSAKLAWSRVLYSRVEGKLPVPVCEQVERGEPMTFREGDRVFFGAYAGTDLEGDALIRVRFASSTKYYSCDWERVRVLRPFQAAAGKAAALPGPGAVSETLAPRVVVQGDSGGTVIKDPLRNLVLRLLTKNAYEKHSYRQYIEHLALRGHHVYLSGGAVRDLLSRVKAKPDIAPAAALRGLTPLDVVTTATADRIRDVVKEIAPEAELGGAWRTLVDDEQGVLNVGGKGGGSPTSRGMTIAPLRAFGYRERARTSQQGKEFFPVAFGHSLEEDSASRDFTMNAVYLRFDVEKSELFLIDPLGGQATADAEARVLRPMPEASLDSDSLLLRFWNFRRRGFNAEPATIKAFKDASAKIFPTRRPERLAELLSRLFFYERRNHGDLELLMSALQEAMVKDGAGEVFTTTLAQRRVREVAQRRLAARLWQG